MGGYVHLIHGKLATWRLEPMPTKKSLLDRILRRQRFETTKITDNPNGDSFIEIPAGNLEKSLIAAFRKYLDRRIPNPWPSTKQIFDSLNSGQMDVYLRGERNAGDSATDWYVQIGFRGFGGMAEVTAELECHWATVWVRDQIEEIATSILFPEGFTPNEVIDDNKVEPCFLPVGKLGYAVFRLDEGSEDAERRFDLDAAIRESYFEDYGDEFLEELEETHSSLLSDGNCHCQLCSPSFDPRTIRTP